MITHVCAPFQSAIHTKLMSLALSNPRTLSNAYYSVKVEEGFGMCVEPVNGSPYIFISKGSTIMEFEPKLGSGTDKLRQRMLASVQFESMVQNFRKSQEKEIAQVPSPVIQEPALTSHD